MPRTPPILALIDGDILLWRAACGAQKNFCFEGDTCLPVCSLADAEDALCTMLASILAKLKTDNFVLCLSDPERNFRKELCPTYKANRADKPRPVALAELRASVTSGKLYPKDRIVMVPGLEADDVLGILATHPVFGGPRRKVIASIDKDFQGIPGFLFNFQTGERQAIAINEADRWHMFQTLTGDRVDGYPGCPGIGAMKAARLLAPCPGFYADLWPVVVSAFEKAKLTEADALVQARLARILRYEDYDFQAKEVRLWNPPLPSTPATTANTA